MIFICCIHKIYPFHIFLPLYYTQREIKKALHIISLIHTKKSMISSHKTSYQHFTPTNINLGNQYFCLFLEVTLTPYTLVDHWYVLKITLHVNWYIIYVYKLQRTHQKSQNIKPFPSNSSHSRLSSYAITMHSARVCSSSV